MTGLPQTQGLTRRADSFWNLQGLLLLCIAGLFSYAYLDTFKELWDYWIEGANWQFVVPIGFIYMLWDRRDLYAGLHREPCILPGVMLLTGGCALLIVGQLTSTHSLREISIVVNIFGLVFLLFGTKYVRNLFWPLIYLLLMTSLTSDMLEYLRYPLKLISATVSADALQTAGYVVYRDGTFLQLPHITLEVADSCSGLNQLVSSIALGIPIAFTILNVWWKRIVIILLSVILGIVMNWVRVILISIWHYESAKQVIHGPYGIYELPFIFLVGVFITLAVAMAMSDKIDASATRDQAGTSGMALRHIADRGMVRASAVGILVLGMTAVYLNTWKVKPVYLNAGLSDLPMSIAGFRGKRIDELGKPFYTGLAHDEFIASFVNEAGTTAKVYIGYFHSQNQQEELIDYRYNWLHEGAEPVEVMSSASALSMKKNRVQGKDTDYTVFFTYYINGRNIIDTKMAKLASLIDVLTRQRSNGAIIMILFDGETYESTGDKEEFLRQVMDMATSRLPGG